MPLAALVLRMLLRRLAAALRLRCTLGFSKWDLRRASERMPSICTLLLKRLKRLSNVSPSLTTTWDKLSPLSFEAEAVPGKSAINALYTRVPPGMAIIAMCRRGVKLRQISGLKLRANWAYYGSTVVGNPLAELLKRI